MYVQHTNTPTHVQRKPKQTRSRQERADEAFRQLVVEHRRAAPATVTVTASDDSASLPRSSMRGVELSGSDSHLSGRLNTGSSKEQQREPAKKRSLPAESAQSELLFDPTSSLEMSGAVRTSTNTSTGAVGGKIRSKRRRKTVTSTVSMDGCDSKKSGPSNTSNIYTFSDFDIDGEGDGASC